MDLSRQSDIFSAAAEAGEAPSTAAVLTSYLVWTVMTSRFRLPAGRTYNVRASELARDRQHTEVDCNIFLLDNTVQVFKVSKYDQGQVLLDIVFKHLDLTERDYFGLQLADDSTDNPRWLDPNKPIRKQLKRGSPYSLNFRVKFFVSDPNKLQEEYTRYQYFLQIKQDILTGRLPCPYNTAALLASFAVQSELGDYNQSENLPGYLSDYSFIPNQPQEFEKEIAKLHQQHTGLSPAEAEFNYLNTARTLELYGVEFHYAREIGGLGIGPGDYDLLGQAEQVSAAAEGLLDTALLGLAE
ncbi:Tyrosine-protein phosphatase non-receptor type 4 [Myotis davidii]|uniref:Tyrosine-protein phosphatase non-receptor type 4 n=1 Tax=Myotis davidii TaxID=225400 RepID=L5LIH6_MYODS|nr:Tyrosine-protein phosphatase non-receptor type 4 [Myotis davidii]